MFPTKYAFLSDASLYFRSLNVDIISQQLRLSRRRGPHSTGSLAESDTAQIRRFVVQDAVEY